MKFCVLVGQLCLSTNINISSIYKKLTEEGNEFVTSIEEADMVVFHPCELVPIRKDVLESISKKRVIILACYNEEDYKEIDDKEFVSLDYFCEENASFVNEEASHIRIGFGCNHHCSYCPIKRKTIKSRKIESILKDIGSAKKIILQADDCASYQYGLIELLDAIPGKEISLIYVYPSYLLSNKDYFIKNKDRISINVLPIQSASKRILKMMNRGDYDSLHEEIDFFNSISFNLVEFIFGYPTETWEDFMETVSFSKKLKKDAIRLWIPYNSYKGTESEKKHGKTKSDLIFKMKEYIEKEMDQNINKMLNFEDSNYGLYLCNFNKNGNPSPLTQKEFF